MLAVTDYCNMGEYSGKWNCSAKNAWIRAIRRELQRQKARPGEYMVCVAQSAKAQSLGTPRSRQPVRAR